MKILIYGGGAVGLGIASALVQSGNHVSILARSETGAALLDNGLAREGVFGAYHSSADRFDVLRQLTESVGFRYVYVPARDQFAHASGIMVLTPEGKVSRYFYGVEYPTRDLRLGLVEAAANRIGSAVDQVLLLCFHYDPTTGKYGFVIMNVIRFAALVTVVGLGMFMVPGFLRDRKKTRLAHQGEQASRR